MFPALCLSSPRATPPSGVSIESHANSKHIGVNYVFIGPLTTKYRPVIVKAAKEDRNTKPNSVICADCDGNGAVQCSQCKGNGVNSVDIFNGQFKAGDSCWLCGGRKEMLCGNCNGAGFVGGFLSTYDQ
ncbi:uncharacterized protein LOC114180802 isoform X2 [Vigna unguiculata]|uniref:uncharacterized protein LOC114162917 isoform X2 n=1 Tax=Vigna unguiculata TaxID=3917 RepID=UPI001017219F|nr:uncharacterized protein LOC114162917 isoform X2 [Vigna unguiculata]XP_027912551.1 uncharacterized protein LOC114172001 isoform X2 [Vigna unguiculata]XP_027922901.1 uncharacterized protein LOC114180802 isoform X2 [Vigna unguiculata]